MANRRVLIAAIAIALCFININCASVVKKNEATLEIVEETKPEPAPVAESEPSTVLAPASQLTIPVEGVSQSLSPPRRQITYDQRQEGKYNIRADLENFMIVLVPTGQSSGSSGASFLDLLKRSSQQQKSKGGANKNHKKYHKPSKSGDKAHVQPDDAITNKLNTLHLAAIGKSPFLQQQAAAALAAEQARRNQPFIEGRTPYHVDISSSELTDSQPQQQQRQQQRPYIYARLLRSLDLGNSRASKSLSEAFGPKSDLSDNSVVLVAAPLPEHFFDGRRSLDYGDSSVNSFADADEDLDSIDRLAAGDFPKSGGGSGDGWDELTLLGAEEQCGPDRRRDSYGICQFVQP